MGLYSKCDIEDAPLEQTYPSGTILQLCFDCASALSGNSVYSLVTEHYAAYPEELDDDYLKGLQ